MGVERHSLLRRQLKKLFGDEASVPAALDRFVEAVDEAYRQSDDDRRMLERSLDLSSQELLERNLELRSLFQALPDLVFRLGPQGEILDVKAGATDDLALEAVELIGRNIDDTPVRVDGGTLHAALRALVADESRESVEYSLELRGETRHYEARVVPFVDDELLVIVRNATTRARAEHELRRAKHELERRVAERTAELRSSNRQLRHEIAEREELEAKMLQTQKLEGLGILAGGIAHDFNNLLMGVLGNASLALGQVAAGSSTHEKLLEIQRAAERAAELTNQMLAYSGRGTCVVERTDLNLLVQEMAHLLNVSISKKARMQCEFGRSVPPIEADATQLRQVVMNLITNASDALGDGRGTILLRTGWRRIGPHERARTYLADQLPEGRYAVLEVIDTGCGMTADTLDKLFDPFFTTKFTGRGLGLASTLGIVRSHHGAICVESAPGRGSTFTVLFPAVGQQAVVESASPARARAERRWHGRGRVLVIDDDETVRTVMRSMLERHGASPLLADGGLRGLELLREHRGRIDCVFLDLTMPEMEGPEVFERIRRIDARVPVVLMSGYARDEAVTRFPRGGLAGFLHKPFRTDELARHLRRATETESATDRTPAGPRVRRPGRLRGDA